MKGKWKILSFIMATILCVAIFAGCGTQENTSSASNEPAVSGAADTTKQIDTMVIGTTMKITSISRETYATAIKRSVRFLLMVWAWI